MFNKKAAMFGLDARIALAIFGALSVITGAALYSAIQNAKVVATITEMKELGKAYEQFILDTGQNLPVNETSPHLFDVRYLLENTDSPTVGWNGPYISYNSNTSKTILLRPNGKVSRIQRTTNDEWGQGDSNAIPCTATKCAAYVRFDELEPAIADAIDIKIDGAKDYRNGNVRVFVASGKAKVMMYLMDTLK